MSNKCNQKTLCRQLTLTAPLVESTGDYAPHSPLGVAAVVATVDLAQTGFDAPQQEFLDPTILPLSSSDATDSAANPAHSRQFPQPVDVLRPDAGYGGQLTDATLGSSDPPIGVVSTAADDVTDSICQLAVSDNSAYTSGTTHVMPSDQAWALTASTPPTKPYVQTTPDASPAPDVVDELPHVVEQGTGHILYNYNMLLRMPPSTERDEAFLLLISSVASKTMLLPLLLPLCYTLNLPIILLSKEEGDFDALAEALDCIYSQHTRETHWLDSVETIFSTVNELISAISEPVAIVRDVMLSKIRNAIDAPSLSDSHHSLLHVDQRVMHPHSCQGCQKEFEHCHRIKHRSHAKLYAQACDSCLAKHCFLAATQGLLAYVPFKTVGLGDIRLLAKRNSTRIYLRSPSVTIGVGNYPDSIVVDVDMAFTHAISAQIGSATVQGRFAGTVALAGTHSVREILEGLARSKKNYSFYNSDDRALTMQRYQPQCPPNVKPKVQNSRPARPTKQKAPRPTKRAPPPPPAPKRGPLLLMPPPGPKKRNSRRRRAGYTGADYEPEDSPYQTGVSYRIPDDSGGVFDQVVPNARGVFDSASFKEKEFFGEPPARPTQPTFEAARWAANSLDMVPFEKQVDHARGIRTYNAADVAASIMRFITDKQDLPRRFENTVAKHVSASALITLDAGNFTEGDTVIVVCPNLSASRGAIVLTKSPGDVYFRPTNFISAVIPQIDTEQLGALQNVNGSLLSVGIQQSTGADSSVASFSNNFEGTITTVSPFSTIAGKASYANAYHASLMSMVTNKTMTIGKLNYGVPDHLVRTGGAYDRQSTNVDIAAGLIAPPANASLATGDAFVVDGSILSTGNIGNGQTMVSSLSVAAGATTIFWQLEEHSAALRHLLYGNFHLHHSGIFIRVPVNAQSRCHTGVTIEFIDGSTETYSRNYTLTGNASIDMLVGVDIDMDYVGAVAEAASGKLISNIYLSLYNESTSDAVVIQNTAGFVRLQFDAINAATDYSMIAVTGARLGQTLAINLNASAEITLDPTGDVARYLEPDRGPAVNAKDMSYMIHAMHQEGAHLFLLGDPANDGTVQGFRAGPFGEKIKKFFKNVFRTIGPILGPLGGVIGAAIPGAGPITSSIGAGIGNALGQAAQRMPRAAPLSLTSHRFEQEFFESATFSSGRSNRRTGFQFPVIDAENGLARVVDVVQGRSQTSAPDFLQPFRAGLSGDDIYTGSSCDLAFLLAALKLRGAPVLPGIYTGEVRNVTLCKDSVTFDLLPVALTMEKDATFGQNIKLMAAPTGLLQNGEALTDTDRVFAGFKAVRVHPITPPDGYPGVAHQISLLW